MGRPHLGQATGLRFMLPYLRNIPYVVKGFCRFEAPTANGVRASADILIPFDIGELFWQRKRLEASPTGRPGYRLRAMGASSPTCTRDPIRQPH